MTSHGETPPTPSPIQAVAAERERIATQLHDEVVQTLSAAGLRAELVRAVLGEAAPDEVGELRDTLTSATRELRAVMDALRRPEIATIGLARALRERIAAMGPDGSTSVLDDLMREPSDELGMGLLWLAEEAVRALRHAGTYGAITVTLRSSLTAFEIDVSATQIADARRGRLSLDGVSRLAILVGATLTLSEPRPGVTCLEARVEDAPTSPR